jgi:DNA/RNA-binding domain of Phe-tRNA-synthetase-like protein
MKRVCNLVPDPAFAAAVVLAEGLRVAPAPEELGKLIDELAARRAAEDFPSAPAKEAVRGLLRRGGFKPTGRNKPASEYLAQAAREGRFPRINNIVDVNNLLSLETGLPISLLDRRAFGEAAWLRRGRPGERYVFNAAGQEIDLEGLVCVCGGDSEPEGAPLGNPVKDSMTGKVRPDTDAAVGVIYADARCVPERELAAHAERFAQLLRDYGGAASAEVRIVASGGLG